MKRINHETNRYVIQKSIKKAIVIWYLEQVLLMLIIRLCINALNIPFIPFNKLKW